MLSKLLQLVMAGLIGLSLTLSGCLYIGDKPPPEKVNIGSTETGVDSNDDND